MRFKMTAAVMLALAVAVCAHAAPKRLLYINHSAGFKHETAKTSGPVME
jgi:hypothetical protein